MDQAIAPVQEAITLVSRSDEKEQAFARPDLVMCLQTLGTLRRSQRRFSEATVALEQSIERYRNLAATRPDDFRPERARGLANHGQVQALAGELPQSLQAFRECLSVFLDLPVQRRRAVSRDLGAAAQQFALVLEQAGEAPDRDPLPRRALDVMAAET